MKCPVCGFVAPADVKQPKSCWPPHPLKPTVPTDPRDIEALAWLRMIVQVELTKDAAGRCSCGDTLDAFGLCPACMGGADEAATG